MLFLVPRFLVFALTGGAALCLTKLTLDIYLDVPEVRAGQYELVFLVLFPLGAALAVVAGVGCTLIAVMLPRVAAWLLLVTAVFTVALCFRLGFVPSQWGGPWRNLFVGLGLPLLWSLVLAAGAVRCFLWQIE